MTDFDRSVQKLTLGWGLDIEPELEGLCELLLTENKKYNLTAIRDKDKVAVYHMADSLFLLTCADFKNKKVLDVGCGAGFPGLPLKFCEPSIRLTSMDSTAKKTAFVKMAAEARGAEVEVLTARAEEACVPPLRESFDIVCSRAVAEMRVLCELCLPYVKPGGLFLAMKNSGEEELAAARAMIGTLGGAVEARREYTLDGESMRQVIAIRKQRPTPPGYPRAYAKIKRQK